MSDKLTNLITDWIVIMTAGQTIDGREVTPKMISDCAGTYDRKLYTAKINWEHRDYLSYFGKVWETKEGVAPTGVQAVLARLSATADLVHLAREMNGIFFSGEIHLKFPKTGGAYLYGLAGTTRPACMGLEEFKLSERTGGNLLAEPVECKELVLLSDTKNDIVSASSESKLTKILNILQGKDMSDKTIKTLEERLSFLESQVIQDSNEDETDTSEETENLANEQNFGRVLGVLEKINTRLSVVDEIKETNNKFSKRLEHLEKIANIDQGEDIAEVTTEFNDDQDELDDDQFLA